MAVHTALSAGEYTNIRGAATARWYLSVVNSSDVATAQVNMPGGITFPAATLTVDTTSGNWSQVSAGNTFALGSAPGLSDYGLYRVRKFGDATHIHVGETAEGDPGLITQAIRNATFGDNAYITVYLRRRDIWSVIPRIIASTGQIFEDYDIVETTENSNPESMLLISFNNTDRRAGFADDGQTYRTVQFDAVEDGWPTTSSWASRQWFVPSAFGAPVAGSSISASVTYRVPQSAENYEVEYQAIDNNGITSRCYRQVWSHGRSGATAPLKITPIGGITYNRRGIRVTFGLPGAGLASIPKGAMVILWCEARFNGADIPSAITQFVGWVVQQTEYTRRGERLVDMEIAGPLDMLERLGAYSQFFDKKANPVTWQEIVTTLEYVDFLTWWVAKQRARGITECFNWTRIGMSNLTGRLPQWKIEASGNLLAQMQSIAKSYGGNIGANPDGSIVVRRHPNMFEYGARGALAIRAVLNETRYHDVELPRQMKPRIRLMRGEGFYWNGSSDLPDPLLSDAPGDAPGQASADETLPNQTVDNQDFLDKTNGLWLAHMNNPYPAGTVNIEGFWPFVYPAELQFCSLSIPASLRPDNTALSINIIPDSVTLKPIVNRLGHIIAWDTSLTFEGETSGVKGKPVSVSTQAVPDNPYLRPPPVTAPIVSVGSRNGSEIIAMTTTHLGRTVNRGVNWTPIVKPAGVTSLWDLHLDRFSPLFQSGSGAIRAYLMTNLGLYYCQDLLSGTAVWTLKDALNAAGVNYGEIRTPPVPGRVYVLWGYIPTPFLNNAPTHVERLDNYGSTPVWSYEHGTHFDIYGHGFDCDQYGADEVLFASRHGNEGAKVWRVIGGVATAIYTGVFAFDGVFMIQKPLKTLSGANNSSVGASELIYAVQFERLKKTETGGVSWTDLTSDKGNVLSSISSIAFIDDPRVIALQNANGHLWTATDGVTFTQKQISQTNKIGRCGGFWPRRELGTYRLYTGGELNLCISDDFGTTLTDITGDWVTAVGTLTGTFFVDVVPLS